MYPTATHIAGRWDPTRVPRPFMHERKTLLRVTQYIYLISADMMITFVLHYISRFISPYFFVAFHLSPSAVHPNEGLRLIYENFGVRTFSYQRENGL